MLMYSGLYTVNLIEIRQGQEFYFCLRARCIYSAKYGTCIIPHLYITLKMQCVWYTYNSARLLTSEVHDFT